MSCSQVRYSPCSRAVTSTRRLSKLSPKNPFIKVSEEVREAVASQKPVVALETTIYTHGFPYPENTALASHLESIVRDNGGIPATVGVLNGVARVGFEAKELVELTASAGKPETKKLSRRDLGYICGLGYMGGKLNGGTTISGTMVLAAVAGIKVFATGGLGGVHRGGEDSMDISADLTELGRTRMALVSSGCKSFLDIPRTLEYLETQGVGVGTFADSRDGQVDFPAFWTRNSGIRSPVTIKDEREAAAVIYAQQSMSLESGLLFANPVSAQHSIPKDDIDDIISQALRDAKESGSTGSDNTPFVLKRIREITNGASVTANRALVEANVARGTKVAVHLSNLEHKRHDWSSQAADNKNYPEGTKSHIYTNGDVSSIFTSSSQSISKSKIVADVIVAGSLAIDLSCEYLPRGNTTLASQPQPHTSNPASIRQSLGGVGHNVATALHYLGVSVHLCSNVADDIAGSAAVDMLAKRGLSTAGIRTKGAGARTAQYVAVNDAEKNLVLAMADMDILQDQHVDFEEQWKAQIDDCKPKWLVVDANWGPSTIRKWLKAGRRAGAKVAFEPVSGEKSRRIFSGTSANDERLGVVPDNTIDIATPNALELTSMHDAANTAGLFEREDWFQVIDTFGLSSSGSRDKLVSLTNSTLVDHGLPQQSIKLLPFIPCILTTLGEQGVLMTQILGPGDDRLTSPASAPYVLSRSTDGNSTVGGVYMRLFPPVDKIPNNAVCSVNGVGDTFLGVVIAGLTKANAKNIIDLIDIAQKASVMTLNSQESVNQDIARLRSAL